MRLVFAIITFVAAVALLASGILARSAPEPELKYDYEVTSVGAMPLTIIDGATLNALDGRQTLTISGPGEVVAASARHNDVLAWIGNASYNEIAFRDADGAACTPDPAMPEACDLVSIRHLGTEITVPNPYGGDLWLEDFRDEGSLRMTQTVPVGVTYLVASDGASAAPPTITISWPSPPSGSRDVAAWLIISGAVVGIIGLVLLLTVIFRMRHHGGPRRRMPKVPKRPMIKTVRSSRVLTRVGAGIVGIAVASVVITPVVGPASAETPAPTPTPGTSEQTTPIPALDERQIRRVIGRVTSAIGSADASLDVELASSRLAGPALELKLADYALQSLDAGQEPASPHLPDGGELALSLPQQVPPASTTWPRTLFAVIADPAALEGAAPRPTPTSTEETEAPPPVLPPVAMLLVQDGPRANYKVSYLVALQADIPEVPAAEDGAAVLPPDSSLVAFPLADVTPAYVDVLVNDVESTHYEEFDIAADRFIIGWGLGAQQQQQEAQRGQESPNNMGFTTVAGDRPPIALATTDGGAIVVGSVRQTAEVTPAESGAKVIAQGDVHLLSGIERSERGYNTVYAGQLLFYVPPLDSEDQIEILGFAGGIVSSQERG